MAWYWIVLIVLAALWLLTVAVYWFNLENKLIYYTIMPLLKKHYDNIRRDRRF